MNVVSVVQARMGSTRLPGKVVVDVGGLPLLELLLLRLKKARLVDTVVLAIPATEDNQPLIQLANRMQVSIFEGSDNDVLDRMYGAARANSADLVVRITADCPLIDPAVVDMCIETLRDEGLDYVTTDETFPDGFDVEVMTADVLRLASESATNPYDREHVTPWIRENRQGSARSVSFEEDLAHLRLTVDEPEDLEVVRGVLRAFPDQDFGLTDIAHLHQESPDLFQQNQHLRRNEGASMSNGQKMWRRAQRSIAGGNMLLSKNPEMHLPGSWPTYFSRARGCKVWDLDGNEYVDAGMMGIGTNILGYGHPRVDEAVLKVVQDGNLSTLNAPEEVMLAERLVELHPWSDQVRFTRSGGEACAVAVRIARAASGRDRVAFCGYHGWHDWYLAANLGASGALDDHLLPGLMSAGVPRALAGTSVPFNYNDLDGLESVLRTGGFGVIIMEVERSSAPNPGFLQGVLELSRRFGCVVIFDECTSGFRGNLGGRHLLYGVEPDIAVFGKTLGNGYAINAVIGRAEVMEAIRSTFISSTFWTERIGLAAGLATLRVMEEEGAPARVDKLGRWFRETLGKHMNASGVPINFAGLPALTSFGMQGVEPGVLKSFINREFLQQGYLSGTALYASIAHEGDVAQNYVRDLSHVLSRAWSLHESGGLTSLVGSSSARTGFQRLA
jgi:glutamate-1-semialdehyde 2,1-aminomutase